MHQTIAKLTYSQVDYDKEKNAQIEKEILLQI